MIRKLNEKNADIQERTNQERFDTSFWRPASPPSRLTTGQKEEVRQIIREEIGLQEKRPEGSASGSADVSDLYRESSETAYLRRALDLLDEGTRYLQQAASALTDDDQLASADELNKFGALLPELFCCRSLGEGLGALVNALHSALRYRKDFSWSQEQLATAIHAWRKLRSEPFMSFETALPLIMKLGNLDLVVTPPQLSVLAEIGDEDQSVS